MKELIRILANAFFWCNSRTFGSKIILFLTSCSKRICYLNFLIMKPIKFWKPNIFQKIIYRLGVQKDPRYNGSKVDWRILDEEGQTADNVIDRWKMLHNFLNK